MIREVYKKVKRDKDKDIFDDIKNESLKLAAQTNKREWKIKDEHLKEYIQKGHIEFDDDYIYFHTTFSTDDANVAQTSHFNLKVARMKRIFQILTHPRDAEEAVFFGNVLNFLINNGITRESTMEQLWKAVESGSGSKNIFWEFENYLLHERGYVIPRTSKRISKPTKSKGKGKTSLISNTALKSTKNKQKTSKTKSSKKAKTTKNNVIDDSSIKTSKTKSKSTSKPKPNKKSKSTYKKVVDKKNKMHYGDYDVNRKRRKRRKGFKAELKAESTRKPKKEKESK